jgi:hypothetical protein
MKLIKMPFEGEKDFVSAKFGGARLRTFWNLFILLVFLGVVHGAWTEHKKLLEARTEAGAAAAEIARLKGELEKAKQVDKKRGATSASKPASKPVATRTYVVEEGEDLISIAIKFGVRPSAIIKCNDMDENAASLAVGQVIKIPEDAEIADSKKKAAEPPPPSALEVNSVKFDGMTTVTIYLSAPADETVLREYIKVAPVNGAVGFNVEGGRWNPRVEVTGDFPFRKPVTLRVRSGFPARKDAEKKPLAQDFTYTFTRKDARPEVVFADKGRYLPPDGKRLLAVSSINVTNLLLSVARVPAANIVQLLAREEKQYKSVAYNYGNGISADSEHTSDLTDSPREWKTPAGYRQNEYSVVPLAVKTTDGAPSNGVFLVTARSADKDRHDWYDRWDDDNNADFNPLRHRLVCITDIGVSVRRTGRKLHVWTTSLLKGVPAEGCRITVYSTSNVRLGSGVTGKDGLAVVDCAGELFPFAVVAESADGSDTAFMALSDAMEVEETGVSEMARDEYLKRDACTAFAWTERGIYRHGEEIFFHALIRNGRGIAPKPFPVELRLIDPEGRVDARRTVIPDALGALAFTGFSVGHDRPGGSWDIRVVTPGDKGVRLGEASFSVEEFVPPQIRVKVAPEGDSPTNFAFAVTAEHLFGGPARHLRAEGAVLFQDASFSPAGWKGYRFGDEKRGLKPNFRHLRKTSLDEKGSARFEAGLSNETGLPMAAVRAIGQGTVFEDGGRPANARAEKILHFYPNYIGATLGETVRIPETGFASVSVACVLPDGKRLAEPRRLEVSFSRLESVYSCKTDGNGWNTWTCDKVEVPCSETITIETKADGDVPLSIPFREGGDYFLAIRDPKSGAGFGASFWLSTWGDDTVRAPMANPSAVTIAPDKPFYRPGERPRIVVKSPFAGHALLTVMRDQVIHIESFALTNATTEIELPAAAADWAPNADVSLAVVRGANSGTARQSVRAYGAACLRVRPLENELPVKVAASVACGGEKGSVVTADVTAFSPAATGAVAVVTVVDEGINILTGQKTPDPISFFAEPRFGDHPLWDLFGRLLPVWDGDPAKVRGVKTGGGFGEDLLGRVSPVPSRRFKPLALWQAAVPLTNGAGRAVFKLPEFVGEVRVTAVAYSSAASGAASVQKKVAPKLVMQSDAPRFVAPGDSFDATLTLTDRGGKGVEALWEVSASGAVVLGKDVVGKAVLAKDGSTNINVRVVAGAVPGQGIIRFRSAGSGETHEQTIELPVRPAVAARETAGAVCLAPGKTRTFAAPSASAGVPDAAVRAFAPASSPLAELSGALAWLADYPHGCLEQTSSQIFPLVAAGGLLNTLTASSDKGAGDRSVYVAAGVKRVVSMIRSNDFVMWPDCSYAPHDREVSLYAAHFLVAADASGAKVDPYAKERVLYFLRRWSVSTNSAVSAYACHTLALAGKPEKDRMIRLYDARAKLRLVDRARLARAFARVGDRTRAAELVKSGADAPSSVREAAFAVLALLDIDPADARLPRLVQWLSARRDAARFSWGTTGENAHALVALASYYRHHPFKEGRPELTLAVGGAAAERIPEKTRRVVKGGGDVTISNAGQGDAWFTWRQIDLPDPSTVTNESSYLKVSRRYLTAEGEPADLSKLVRGDLVIAQVSIEADETREISDLVVQDLFPAALEPVHAALDTSVYAWFKPKAHEWVMRSDARDDRMLVFSRKFFLKKGEPATFFYPLRAVTSGEFILPGPAVEAMYAPEMRAVAAPSRLVVGK